MWKVASQTGLVSINNIPTSLSNCNGDCSDDEVSSCTSREDGLECPVCLEFFNIVENVPYVLWCGHTLCKNCVVGLQHAVVKFLNVPVQLPLLISCPWCLLLSFRLVHKGNLKFPRKNFFLLWMVESMNSPYNSRLPLASNASHSHHNARSSNSDQVSSLAQYFDAERIRSSLRKSLVFFVRLTAKFPIFVFFLGVVFYAVPVSAAIFVLYVVVMILFAGPFLLMLYFAYPSLDWLIKEIFK